MKQYHDLLNHILENGVHKPAARENMPGTTSAFGPQMEFYLKKGFPILTTKKVVFKNIVTELLWFLRGDTNIKYLNDNGFTFWNEDAYNYYKKTVLNGKLNFDEFIKAANNDTDVSDTHSYNYGDCGHQYGKTWRDFNGTDQISRLIKNLKKSPEGRRHVVTSMDPSNDNDLALYWCHSMFQFNAVPLTFEERTNLGDSYISYDGDFDQWLEENSSKEEITKILDENNVPKYGLQCKMYQRSCDFFLGGPYNLSSYALLTYFIAKITNMVPDKFIHTFGDVHIYDNHIDQAKEILSHDVKKYKLPRLVFSDKLNTLISKFNGNYAGGTDFGYLDDFDNFIHGIEPDDIYLKGYQSYKFIKAKLSTGLK